jgi:hypothetical protein
MADLKIRVFKGTDSTPQTTVTVPGGVLKIASKLIPKQAMDALQEKGIDLNCDRRFNSHPIPPTLIPAKLTGTNQPFVI